MRALDLTLAVAERENGVGGGWRTTSGCGVKGEDSGGLKSLHGDNLLRAEECDEPGGVAGGKTAAERVRIESECE